MNQHRWTCLTVFVLNATIAPIAATFRADALPSPATTTTTSGDDFSSRLLQSLVTPSTVTELKTDTTIPTIGQPVPQVSKLPIVVNPIATNPKTSTAPTTKKTASQTTLKVTKIGNLPTNKQQSGLVFLAAASTFSPDLRVPNLVETQIADRHVSLIPTATPVNPVAPLPKLDNLLPKSPKSPTPTTFSSQKIGTPIPVARDNKAPLGKTKVAPTAIVNSATIEAEVAPSQTDNSIVSATSSAKESVKSELKPQAAPVVKYLNDRAEIPSFEAGVPTYVFEDEHPRQIVATAIAQIGETIVAPEPSIAIPVMRPVQSTMPTRSPGATAPAERPFANRSGTVEQSPTTVQPLLNKVVSTQTGIASWYGSEGGSKTANGERYDPQGLTAAHRTLAFGTKVRVTSLKTGKSTIVRINDRGPFRGNRTIDISAGAAEAIGIKNDGIGEVRIEILADRV